MKGVKEQYISAPESGDFTKSWEGLSKQKGDSYIEDNFGVSRRKSGTRIGQWRDKSPEDYTWHHNNNGSNMKFLDQEIHDTFKKKGGASIARNK